MAQESLNSIDRDKVVKIINSVLEKVEAAEDFSRENIFNELRSVQDIIAQMREDIRQTGASEISGKHISSASDELDAVISAAETATETIMDACDAVTAHAESLPAENKDFLLQETTKIFEACSFQDITGQRISKVIRSLKTIEEKVGKLLNILDIPESEGTPEDTREGDARLLNGPQMPDKAINQTDIDKLLADLF